jgi:hypothetical protein
MNGLADILEKKRLQMETATQVATRKINPQWEEAKQFCEYIGIGNDRKTIVGILGLVKRYGAGKVYGSRSFLKDASFDKSKVAGLIVWHITQKNSKPDTEKPTSTP